jgi:uncharacterized protein YfaP (DUF2135 family)
MLIQEVGVVSITYHLQMDLRVMLFWDADNVDVDLHVIEPTGEDCSVFHNSTKVGGNSFLSFA